MAPHTQNKPGSGSVRKPLVYIAGPYTHPDPVINVRNAVAMADRIINEGGVPLIPHLSMLWHTISPKPLETWYSIDLALLMHCDAYVRLPGESVGADAEVRFAVERGIPLWEPGA